MDLEIKCGYTDSNAIYCAEFFVRIFCDLIFLFVRSSSRMYQSIRHKGNSAIREDRKPYGLILLVSFSRIDLRRMRLIICVYYERDNS